MRRGALDKTVELQAPVQPGGTYVTYATVAALLAPVASADLPQKAWIEYRDPVPEFGHRVLYGDRTFYIDYVNNPKQRNQELVLYCTETQWHLLTLQRREGTDDGGGGRVESWVTVDTVPGRVEGLASRDRIEAMRNVPVVDHQITIRWRDDITREWIRVLFDSRTLLVEGRPFDPDGTQRKLQMLALEQ